MLTFVCSFTLYVDLSRKLSPATAPLCGALFLQQSMLAGKRRVVTSVAAMWARARACGRASGCVASSVWAISRPLPGKHFLKDWDFSRGVVTQDGDHFLFADFVVAVAAFVDGLDDRFELFLRDHGLFLGLHGAFAIGTFALFDFGCLTFAPSKK